MEKYETSIFKFILINNRGEDKDRKLERILKLGNAGLMTRKEQQVELSSEFNITVNEDNPYLDMYLINGRTEEEIFERNYNSYNNNLWYNQDTTVDDQDDNDADDPFSTKSLDKLEKELLREAYNLWCVEDGENNTISLKNEAEKRIPPNIQKIIRKHFTDGG